MVGNTYFITNAMLARNGIHDKKFGEVFIVYEENIEEFMVNARFVKTGKTEFTLESKNGKKYTYEIDVQRNRYDLKRISTDEDE